MSSSLAPLLFQRFFYDGGAPLAGGLLYSFQSGTNIPLATFTDVTGDTPNTNPIVLDANGYCDLWIGDTSYKFILHDKDDVLVKMVDPVQSLAAQIAAAISTAGALAVNNNLSDLASVPMALVNLGIAPFQYQKLHAITNNQTAADLTGESFDGTVYKAVIYEFLVIQGTTVGAWQNFVMIYINGVWTKFDGMGVGTNHGIVISPTQATTIGQLQAAETEGLGDGDLYLKRHFVFA